MSLFGKGEGQASGACQMPGRHGSVVGWKQRGRVNLDGRVGRRKHRVTEPWPDAAVGQVPPFWLRRYPARVSDVPWRTWGGQGGLAIWAEQGDGWTFCPVSRWRPRLLDETTATWPCTEDSAAGPTPGFPGAGEGATPGRSQAILGNIRTGGIPPLGMASLWFWRGCADGHLGWWRWGVKGVHGIRGNGGGESRYRHLKLRLGTHGFP